MAFQKGHKTNFGRVRLDMVGENNPAKRAEVRSKIKLALQGRSISEKQRKGLDQTGVVQSTYTKNKRAAALRGKARPQAVKDSIRQTLSGRKHSQERIANIKRGCSYGWHHSSETKRKQRIFALRRVEEQHGFPTIGKNEKAILDKQEQLDGVSIIRQYYIWKLGYRVDGYCVVTNTVYEVYEPYHDKQVQKDLERETDICNLLSCDFVIIWDR